MTDTANDLSTWRWLLEESDKSHDTVRANAIIVMRQASKEGVSNVEIACALGMSQSTVSRILNRRRWLAAWAILDAEDDE